MGADSPQERGDVMEATTLASPPAAPDGVWMLPAKWFLLGCAAAAIGILGLDVSALPVSLLATEVALTILGLFVLGSFKYQVHKNALTYGMALIVIATFIRLPTSTWHEEIAAGGWWPWMHAHLLSFRGLDEIVHADTMLFILGLTYFVAVIAQTRLLEGITFMLLRRNKGLILPTVLSVTAFVAFASGILDGVSMIGLTIRTLVIIMTLAAAPVEAVRYAVMVCTAVTTICGMWLAYGEPPNLIMKANLEPLLDNAFFLVYCAPGAIAAYLTVAWQLRSRLRGEHVDLDEMDVIDANAADVRFLQAARHGEVVTTVELIEAHAGPAEWGHRVIERIRNGQTLGLALIHENVDLDTRRLLLGRFVAEEVADGLDRHYALDAQGLYEEAFQAELAVDELLGTMARKRRQAQLIGGLALIPFIALLVLHGFFHQIPLFVASFAGFLAALPAIFRLPRMRALALREARLEYAEYYFLFPLFLSITLLTHAGFFEGMREMIRSWHRHARQQSCCLHPVSWCRRFSRRFSTTTSSRISRRAACWAWTPIISTCLRWPRLPATPWAGAGPTSDPPNPLSRTRSSSAMWMRTTRRCSGSAK